MAAFPVDRDYLAFTCLDASLDQVRSAIVEIVTGPPFPSRYTERWVSPDDFSLPIQEYNPPTRSEIVWTPRRGPGCVLMSALTDGAHTLVHILGKRFGFTTLSIRFTPDSVAYPIREWSFTKDGEQRRYIRAMRGDSRWEYFTQGDPMEFEVTDDRLPRRISKRLTGEMLLEYSKAVGWELSCADTWSPRGDAIEITTHPGEVDPAELLSAILPPGVSIRE